MRSAWVPVALLLALAGCDGNGDGDGDGGGAAIQETNLGSLVLQPIDVGRSYVRFDEGRQRIADRPEGSDPRRFGRKDGWQARYRRLPATGTKGPLVIESRIDVFESPDGASDEFDSVREQAEKLGRSSGGGKVLDASRLGDEAFAVTHGSDDPAGVRYFVVAWREENATAVLNANGLHGGIAFEQVLSLARKQQTKLARAAT